MEERCSLGKRVAVKRDGEELCLVKEIDVELSKMEKVVCSAMVLSIY